MEDSLFRNLLLRCVRCGSCKITCPTYEQHRNETMSGRGRIAVLHALVAGGIQPSQSALDTVFSCIQCAACSQGCPLGLDIPELIYAGREYLRQHDHTSLFRVIVRLGFRHPVLFSALASSLGEPVMQFLKGKHILPEQSRIRRKTLFHAAKTTSIGRRGRVAVFMGCSTRYLFPHLGEALIRVLERCGYDVRVPEDEVCCGTPLRSLGLGQDARERALRNREVFGAGDADAVVSLCPSCILALRKGYRSLTGQGIDQAMDVVSFFWSRERELLKKVFSEDAFYHDPCHLAYGLAVSQEPRDILERCGIRVVNRTSGACCGFGGTYSIRFREESLRFAQARWRGIEASGAKAVFTACPGCMLQLQKGSHGVPVHHIIEAIEKALA